MRAPHISRSPVYSAKTLRRLGLILAMFLILASAGATPAGADPNDPYWPQEWGPILTRASDLWQYSTGDPSIVIAVVDTGLSATPQPDMSHVVPGWDILGNDANTADSFGHGTWVSTVIGAQGNNGVGIAGYCWSCSIMPVRVAAGREGTVSGNITAGIRYAVDHGARIINVSLASNQFDINEYGAVEYALDHGVLIVAAAGNGGNTNLLYPAADGATLGNVLSVAGSDQNDQLYTWASRGPTVALSAPGCAEFLDPWIGAASACGSSFAPPVVTGIAGLLLSMKPGLTMYQIVGALRATARPIPGIAGGRVDAWAAAHYLGLVPQDPPPPPVPVVTPPFVSPQVLVSTGSVRRARDDQASAQPGPARVAAVRAGGQGLHDERPDRRDALRRPRGRADRAHPVRDHPEGRHLRRQHAVLVGEPQVVRDHRVGDLLALSARAVVTGLPRRQPPSAPER